jgi:putative endonuclease
MRTLYVYILASRSRMLYTGMTNNLAHRLRQHRNKEIPGFTRRYNVTRLVYYETYDRPRDAIAREKEIKGGRRAKKVSLIEADNPIWEDWGDELLGM